MKKILNLFAAVLLSFSAMAKGVEIAGIHYLLDMVNHTASVTYTGDHFGDNQYVGDIVVPDSVQDVFGTYVVTGLGNYAFAYCYSLTSVTLPNTVNLFGDRTFENSTVLTRVNIPNSVLIIADHMFDGCSSLTDVNIPQGVTHIGEYAFRSCTSLTKITIPSDAVSIGLWAFSSCSALTSITCLAQIPPSLGSNVFYNMPHSIPLYVPTASIPLYQAADQWCEFDVQPLLVEIDPITPSTTELTWEPVDSASLYQLRIYTDSTSSVALDTTLLINADSLNGGIMLQNGTSVARRVKKIVQDAGGTIIVITIDPTSGTSEENPYKVTVSTVSDERIDVHFDMTVFQGTEILREESGTFVLNEDQPEAIQNTLAPSLPTGIYDLYGHRYPASAWESLPAGVYVLRTEDRVEKVMK